jgi:NitT/TauT family transport system substrate-binding protein
VTRLKAILTGLALSLAVVGGPAAAQTSTTPSLTKLRVAYVPLAGSVTIFLAKDKGMFAKRGLDVEPIFLRSAVEVVPGLVSGSLDVGMLPTSSLVQAVDSGVDLVALTGMGVLHSGSKESAIVARTGSDIQEAKDLKGKKVLVISIGSISQVLLEKWLRVKGVDPQGIATIQYSEASLPQMVDVIKTGTVDVALLAEPFLTTVTRAGSGRIVSYFMGELPDDTQTMLNAATRSWAEQHKTEVKAFQAAIAEAVDYAKAHRDETEEAISRWLKLKPEIVAMIPFPDVSAEMSEAQLNWWIDTMKEQGRLRNSETLSAAAIIVK